MKKYLLASLAILLISLPAWAQTEHFQGPQTVPADTTHIGNYYAAGSDVSIDGTVTGDAFLVGSTIRINGTVQGDIFALGGTIEITSEVPKSLRVIGGQVIIQAPIRGNASIAANTVRLEQAGAIDGELAAVASRVNLLAPVGGNADVITQNFYLDSAVGRNLNLIVSNDLYQGMQFGGQAAVTGNLTYQSERQFLIPEKNIGGEVTYQPLRLEAGKKFANKMSTVGWWFGRLIYVLGLIVLGLVFLSFMRKKMWQVTDIMETRMGKSMWLGLLFLILIPVVSLALMITVIGIPLGLLILTVYLSGLYLFAVWAALYVGRAAAKLMGKKSLHEHWQLVIGAIIFVLLTSLPYIGWLIYLLSLLWTWGAIYLVKKETIKAWQ